MKSSSRGFTLIELLVVIAIIGILSSVVLASLTSARTKGTDAAIQNELANMRAQAELYYSSNSNSYGVAFAYGLCSGAGATTMFAHPTATGSLLNLVTDARAKAGTANVGCGSSVSAWAVQASTSAGTWCVDSSGASKLGSMNQTTFVCS